MLACFGGAGGQHACAIARNLGMSQVFIHRYSGILSAYGLALADVVHEAQEPCAKEYGGLILYSLVSTLCTRTSRCSINYHMLPKQPQHLTILMLDLML